ncbi:hypothetical protein ABH905_004616 [Pseudomonas frederiksbergensis]
MSQVVNLGPIASRLAPTLGLVNDKDQRWERACSQWRHAPQRKTQIKTKIASNPPKTAHFSR